MTSSLSTHCILTAPSPETMSGKGREGNKEGKGRDRVETAIHSSSSVTRAARDGWMGATRFIGGVR